MNRDRGTIKWNALMLPEHVKMLREWKAEDQKIRKPDVEFWQLEEMNNRLQQALNEEIPVRITVWRDNQLLDWVGVIERFQQSTQKLYFKTGEIAQLHELVEVEIEIIE